MTPTKVLIGLPCEDTVIAPLFESFWDAIELHPEEGRTPDLGMITYRNAVAARNDLVKKLLEGDFTHLFFMDSDMKFPAASLGRLLQHDKDIVGGFYVRKRSGFLANAFVDIEKGRTVKWCDKLEKVDALGTGCMLIKRKVFETMAAPWFEYKPYPEDSTQVQTEDVVFCDKARALGFEIWCDGTIKCGHVGMFIVTPKENGQVGIEPL